MVRHTQRFAVGTLEGTGLLTDEIGKPRPLEMIEPKEKPDALGEQLAREYMIYSLYSDFGGFECFATELLAGCMSVRGKSMPEWIAEMKAKQG